MVDEIYDIFDEQGHKIGKASWTECHKKGLLHSCASAMIFKDISKHELLIHKRSSTMAQDPNLWQHSAGGHIVTGDSVEKGVLKEVQEELFWKHGLPKLSLRKVLTFLNEDMPNNREFLTLFEIIYPGPFYFDPEELAEQPKWVEWSTLLKDMHDKPQLYAPVFHNIVQVYQSPDKYTDGPQF